MAKVRQLLASRDENPTNDVIAEDDDAFAVPFRVLGLKSGQ